MSIENQVYEANETGHAATKEGQESALSTMIPPPTIQDTSVTCKDIPRIAAKSADNALHTHYVGVMSSLVGGAATPGTSIMDLISSWFEQ